MSKRAAMAYLFLMNYKALNAGDENNEDSSEKETKSDLKE